MKKDKVRKPRPYWHVDAKWMVGIVLFFLLGLTFFSLLLVQLTGPLHGIDTLTMMMASSFSVAGGGMDDAADIEMMQYMIATAPDGKWQPIPGMLIFVTEEDIEGKTPREARLWFFRQWAEPVYYEGAPGLADLITDPEMVKGLDEGIGVLSFISPATHSIFLKVFAGCVAVSIVFLALMLLFSYRYGRLSSTGFVILLAALPGLVLTTIGRAWANNASQAPPPTEETLITRYTSLAADVLPDVATVAQRLYLILALFGFMLILVAIVCTLIWPKPKVKPVPLETTVEPESEPLPETTE
ncbi:MAG: hypothetical protein MUO40_12555 [Anaerolineaceae bacterium]|nr:hypothetical protein [Anaerolineaceae bacterium]